MINLNERLINILHGYKLAQMPGSSHGYDSVGVFVRILTGFSNVSIQILGVRIRKDSGHICEMTEGQGKNY